MSVRYTSVSRNSARKDVIYQVPLNKISLLARLFLSSDFKRNILFYFQGEDLINNKPVLFFSDSDIFFPCTLGYF